MAILLKPPPGGFQSIKFLDHLVPLDGFADAIKELAEKRADWENSVKSLDEPQPDQAINLVDKVADGPGGDRDADLRQAVAAVRTEVQQLSKELRSAFVGIVAGGDTALAAKLVIQSSAVYKVGADSSTTGLALVYALQLARDFPAKRGTQRFTVSLPLLSEEFQKFAEVTKR